MREKAMSRQVRASSKRRGARAAFALAGIIASSGGAGRYRQARRRRREASSDCVGATLVSLPQD